MAKLAWSPIGKAMSGSRISVMIAALCLATAGCGSGATRKATEPDATSTRAAAVAADRSADLPQLARALIPKEAREGGKEELTVEECGIAPVFPCVRTYFVIEDLKLEERLALLRERARSAGWRIVSERQDAGVVVELERESFRATLMVEAGDSDPILCEAASLCLAGTMLTVFGPPAPLPAPSAAERARWSVEKTTFVREADAVCTEMLARAARRPDALADAFGNGYEELAALDAPAGEDDEVERILRPLRILVRAARALTDDEGEDALPAAVAVGEFAKRFNHAAARYGLEACAAVG